MAVGGSAVLGFGNLMHLLLSPAGFICELQVSWHVADFEKCQEIQILVVRHSNEHKNCHCWSISCCIAHKEELFCFWIELIRKVFLLQD